MTQKPTQLNLFDDPAVRLGAVPKAIKAALGCAVAESGLSRDEIVFRADGLAKTAGINLCPGGGLSIHTFNKWLDINDQGHMPTLLGLIVLSQILNGDTGAFNPALEVLGKGVMEPDDKKFSALGRAVNKLKKARHELKKAEEQL